MGRKTKSNTAKEEFRYEFSSGNVFQDFQVENPEEAKAKSDLAFQIRCYINNNQLTQEEAAIMMGLDQPKVSKITRGILSEFTIDRLISCLIGLGFDIEIKPTLGKSKKPSIHVTKIQVATALRH